MLVDLSDKSAYKNGKNTWFIRISAVFNVLILKDKKNTAGTIIKAFNKAGDALTKCLGKKISSLKDAYTAEEYLDFDVETKQGHNVRVIRAKSTDRDGNTGFVYIRTIHNKPITTLEA